MPHGPKNHELIEDFTKSYTHKRNKPRTNPPRSRKTSKDKKIKK